MIKHVNYKTNGVCSREIEFDIEEGIVKNIRFIGGCRGNTQGVARLAEGMTTDEIVKRLKGIECRGNNSCPNQLAIAIEKEVENSLKAD